MTECMSDNSKESDDSSQYDKLALPSSPKGEIVGIMIHMLYLMATHSSQMINYSAEKSSRIFMKRKVPFMQRKVSFGTPSHIQRGISFRNFSKHSRGVWTAKEENILVRPFPLLSKGESDLVLLPSSPKGRLLAL